MDRTIVQALYELSNAIMVIEDFSESQVVVRRYEGGEISCAELIELLVALAEQMSSSEDLH